MDIEKYAKKKYIVLVGNLPPFITLELFPVGFNPLFIAFQFDIGLSKMRKETLLKRLALKLSQNDVYLLNITFGLQEDFESEYSFLNFIDEEFTLVLKGLGIHKKIDSYVKQVVITRESNKWKNEVYLFLVKKNDVYTLNKLILKILAACIVRMGDLSIFSKYEIHKNADFSNYMQLFLNAIPGDLVKMKKEFKKFNRISLGGKLKLKNRSIDLDM